MATRKRGSRGIPGALAQGRDVFPITPFRTSLAVTTSGTNEKETIDLDLQFEDNEVLDVWSMHVDVYPAMDLAPDAVGDLQWACTLYEDPDVATTTSALTEATWETNNAIMHAEIGYYAAGFATAAGFYAQNLADSRYFVFPQPFTVARNLAVIAEALTLTSQGDVTSIQYFVEIWGRRRNANDVEFKNIIYRQRF